MSLMLLLLLMAMASGETLQKPVQRSLFFPVITAGQVEKYSSLRIDKGASTSDYILNVSQTAQCSTSTFCLTRAFPGVLTGDRLLGQQNKCISVEQQVPFLIPSSGVYYLNGRMLGTEGCSAVAVLHGFECANGGFGEQCEHATAFPQWKDNTVVPVDGSVFWAVEVPPSTVSDDYYGSLMVTIDTSNATGFFSCAYSGFPTEFTEDKGIPIDPVTTLGYAAARPGVYFFRVDNMGTTPLILNSARVSLENCSATSYGPNCEHVFNRVRPGAGPEWTTVQRENSTLCSADWCFFQITSEWPLTVTLLSGTFYFKTLNAPTVEDFDIALFSFNAEQHLSLLQSSLTDVILGAPADSNFILNITVLPPQGLNGNQIVGILIGAVTGAVLLFLLVCNVTLKVIQRRRQYDEI